MKTIITILTLLIVVPIGLSGCVTPPPPFECTSTDPEICELQAKIYELEQQIKASGGTVIIDSGGYHQHPPVAAPPTMEPVWEWKPDY